MIPYSKQTISTQDIDVVSKALSSDYLTTGPRVKEFENLLSSFCDARYCIAFSSATAALHIASLVLLQKGDKVLTTPNSFLSTSNSILYANAKPIFVDILQNGNIDLDLCEAYLKKDSTIKAIYVVSFSGNMVDQNRLKELKNKYNILILEDNSHTIGAIFDGIKAGSCKNSDISIFSFHPVKNMTTGEGGAITTNSKDIYEKCISLRVHGMVKTSDMKPWEYEMRSLGYNYRITDFQCALGISQLEKLPTFIEKRVQIAKKYDKAFENSIINPLYKYNGKSAYHLYVVQVDFDILNITKEQLFNELLSKNIIIQLHYIPINNQPYYKSIGYGNEYTPIMDIYYKKSFSIPIYPLLSNDEQDYVIKTLFELLK
jgi:UDP-4-amino-4,6-dideoxy-L-N-acetyl-beta-L-altrosamine transaminase